MGATGLSIGSDGHCTIIDPLSDGALLHMLALYPPTTHAVAPQAQSYETELSARPAHAS